MESRYRPKTLSLKELRDMVEEVRRFTNSNSEISFLRDVRVV